MYQSAAYIDEFYTRISSSAQKITTDYEIIFVNDGSPDESLEKAISLYQRDKRVKVIDLSRNFGQHKAIMTGLSHAKGQLVFLLDCDLEEAPELLEKFHIVMKDSGADVVYGTQEKRKGAFIERITGNLFYTVFNLLSQYPVPKNVTTARLMTQNYVANLVEHRDREVFLLGLWTITGFKQVPVVVRKDSKGSSAYNIARKISIVVNSITSFSNRPLVYIFYLGLIVSMLSAIAALYLIIKWARLRELGSPIVASPASSA
jgi:putative glycosyltransferase